VASGKWQGARNSRQSGFTLLEVLVAVAILAVALGALIKAASDNAANAAYLRDRTYAHWVALNQVARYQVGLEAPHGGTRRGVSEMAGRQWYWQARFDNEDVSVEGIVLEGLLRLDVEVRDRDDADATPLARVSGYLR
jgi:general secretion pathway protein I